jgi:hypothetical protein
MISQAILNNKMTKGGSDEIELEKLCFFNHQMRLRRIV